MELLTLDKAIELAPKSHRGHVTQSFVDLINDCIQDPVIGEEFKDNMVSYNSVLQSGKYKLTSYVEAVRYVSYKLLGKSNQDAYKATFPDRVARLEEKGVEDISPYVSAYNSNQLVVAIMQQTLVPTYVLNQHMHQDALNRLHGIVISPTAKDRDVINACNSILEYTKQPEKTEMTLDINVTNNVIEDMQSALKESAKEQLSLLQGGGSLRGIVEARILKSEVIDVTPES